MALETGDFIDDLNLNNPVGATDTVATLDDHIRLIKKVLLQSFTGISGDVTKTHTELNDVVEKAAAATIAGLHDYTTIPTINSSLVAVQPILQNVQNGNYTLVLGDAPKHIYKASGGAGETITIPANSSVAFPIGTAIPIVNQGGGTLSIAITTDVMQLEGAGTTGTRTLADDGIATILKVTATLWMISGGTALT